MGENFFWGSCRRIHCLPGRCAQREIKAPLSRLLNLLILNAPLAPEEPNIWAELWQSTLGGFGWSLNIFHCPVIVMGFWRPVMPNAPPGRENSGRFMTH